LQKGQNVILPTLNEIRVEIGWTAIKKLFSSSVDCDASAYLYDKSGGILDKICYSNLRSVDKAVCYTEDNIVIIPGRLDDTVHKIVFELKIYSAISRHQNFSLLKNLYIRLFISNSSEDLVRFDLNDKYTIATKVYFGELSRKEDKWLFTALGVGDM